MVMMLISVLLLLALHFALPFFLFINLCRSRRQSKARWLSTVLITGGFVAFLFIAGRWDWFSIYLRPVYVVLFAALLVFSWRDVRHQPFIKERGQSPWRRYAWPLLELVLVLGILAFTASGLFLPDEPEPVRLAFPLQDGDYYVAQGGSSQPLNAHTGNSAQEFAVDITEINDFGFRTTGLYPAGLDKYVIFGEPIYSPCAGTILRAQDGLPDNIPPETDSTHPAGNHVVIGCRDVRVLLAHMQQGSIMVEEGDVVSTGQLLGRVGNTGNTTEPHLHIHAAEEGQADILSAAEAVPILFANDYPVRNTIFAQDDSTT